MDEGAIREALKRLGVPHERIGKALGTSRWPAKSFLDGKRILKAKEIPALEGLIAEFEEAAGERESVRPVGSDHGGRGQRAFVFVNEYDVAPTAGDGALIDSEKVLGTMPFRADFLSYRTSSLPAQLAVLRVDGDSMEPLMRSGDHILVDRAVMRVGTDGIYVFQHSGALHIKRLQSRIGQPILVRSDNPSYDDWKVDETDITIVGKVIWLGRSI